MKTIIAGSRDIDDYDVIKTAVLNSGYVITEVVSGRAKGVDKLGERWATDNNIPVKEFPAHWNTYGKTAGFRRNNEMAKYADALIAVWDGRSKGTRHMIDTATREGLRVYVQVVGERGK